MQIGTTETRNPNTMNIDMMSSAEIVKAINDEDHKVADAIQSELPEIAKAVDMIVEKLQMQNGELAFCGSVITKNEVVIEKLKSKLKAKYPELKCIQPKMDAAFGSALRALEEV